MKPQIQWFSLDARTNNTRESKNVTPVLQIPSHDFQCPFLGNKGQSPQGGAIKPGELVLDGREGIWGESKEAPIWVMPSILWSSLVAQRVKRLLTTRDTRVRSLGWEDPGRRKWQPTPVLLPGKSHGRRSLVDYNPWDRKELDMTERLHFHLVSFGYDTLQK